MLNRVAQGRLALARYTRGGVAPTSPYVLERINECQSRLLRKGDWDGALRVIRFFTDKNYITLDDSIAAIRGVNVDRNPSHVFNRSYMFMEGGPGEWVTNGYGTRDLIEATDTCTAFTMPSTAMKLIAFSKHDEGAAGMMRVNGRLENMENVVTTSGSSGETFKISRWKNGIEGDIDIGTSFLSNAYFSDVDAIAKPTTKGYVTLLAYDQVTHQTFFLGKYRPDETSPRYRRYSITNQFTGTGSSVLCLCKMAHVPLYDDEDILIVQNMDAMIDMAQAIEMRPASANQSAQYEALALNEMAAEKRDKMAPNQFVTVDGESGIETYNMV